MENPTSQKQLPPLFRRIGQPSKGEDARCVMGTESDGSSGAVEHRSWSWLSARAAAPLGGQNAATRPVCLAFSPTRILSCLLFRPPELPTRSR